jgi:hypothetical protein
MTALRRCGVALISAVTCLKEELQLKLFENRVLRRIFGYRIYEIMEK